MRNVLLASLALTVSLSACSFSSSRSWSSGKPGATPSGSQVSGTGKPARKADPAPTPAPAPAPKTSQNEPAPAPAPTPAPTAEPTPEPAATPTRVGRTDPAAAPPALTTGAKLSAGSKDTSKTGPSAIDGGAAPGNGNPVPGQGLGVTSGGGSGDTTKPGVGGPSSVKATTKPGGDPPKTGTRVAK
jgi:hypothetical protein